MQAIQDEIRKSVVFIAYKTKENGNEILCGTGCLVSVPLSVEGFHMPYLVTAKHVIKYIEKKFLDGVGDGKVYVRANRVDGKLEVLESSLSQWRFHPDDSSVDAAVITWAMAQKIPLDHKNIPVSIALTEDIIKDEEIGPGDEVFLTGLFHQHSGVKKNLPIIRTGNIALMPEEKVNVKTFGDISAYLIEARSIGGLSGSPVFVYLGNMRVKGGELKIANENQRLIVWMGIMHGHWDIDETDVDTMDVAVRSEDSEERVQRTVNMGIGIVVPATKIIEILNIPEYRKNRVVVSATREKIQKDSLEKKSRGLK